MQETGPVFTNARTWPRVHKAFQNQDQDQAQVINNSKVDVFKNLLVLFNY